MGIKPLLLSLLGVSTLGGVAVGGYYAFNKSNEKEDKSKATPKSTEGAQTQTPREQGAVTSTPTTTTTRTDNGSSTSNTGSSGSSSTAPSQPGTSGPTQLPSR